MPKLIYKRLSDLSFSRPSGTENEQKAAELISEEIRKIGFTPGIQNFTYARNAVKESYLAAIDEDGKEISFPVTGVTDSKETPEDGIVADFYYLKSFDEVSLSRIRGKVVLIHDRLSAEEYGRLKKAGIVGYITTSGTVRDTYENSDLETNRFRDNLKDAGPVPAFTIRLIDAVELLRLKPKKVHIKLSLKTEEVKSKNLVVTIDGDDADEQIIVGAHYDSVPFSLGSWDNGAGAVELLSLLEYFKEKRPKRTIKIIWFGSEETGLKGSRAYVGDNEKDIEKTLTMINVDVGGSILGKEMIFVAGVDSAEIWIRSFLKEVGYEAVTTKKIMSSDSANFNDVGIPTISIGQMPPKGGGYMHTRYDNMDLIDEDVLEAEAGFLIRLVERLDSFEVFPIPRVIPEKLRKEVIDYFGVNQSRLVGIPVAEEEKPLPFYF